jgi:hypothetical protein
MWSVAAFTFASSCGIYRCNLFALCLIFILKNLLLSRFLFISIDFWLINRERNTRKNIKVCNRTDLYRDSINWTPQDWYKNVRMSQQTFNNVCDQLVPKIQKQTTILRITVPVGKWVIVHILDKFVHCLTRGMLFL